ncbi:hypothetical protein AV530_000550 [Patagioenas fasciata monilis]|uniref:Uncharacterized protein n=1 Tax=Patagioenas fasciata monilis TaxID=372326 RepID=A0A1V4IG21_PATFA|nr:hypothetical protein AV530_000550 [Patagioenas fasciata monilis]
MFSMTDCFAALGPQCPQHPCENDDLQQTSQSSNISKSNFLINPICNFTICPARQCDIRLTAVKEFENL